MKTAAELADELTLKTKVLGLCKTWAERDLEMYQTASDKIREPLRFRLQAIRTALGECEAQPTKETT